MKSAAQERPCGWMNPQGFYDEVQAGQPSVHRHHRRHDDARRGVAFQRLGRMLERADKTSRILDVKYFLLLRSAEDVGTPFDDIQWAAVLRSASAFEMYRKRHGRISPQRRGGFPHAGPGVSPRHPVLPAWRRAIHSTPSAARRWAHSAMPRRSCSASFARTFPLASVDEIIQQGLHEYLDDLQTR